MSFYIEKSVLILLFCAISLSLSGKKYYLSPNGNDLNDGSIEQPFFSLNRAWLIISAGDTVYLRGGTYEYQSAQELTGKNGEIGKLIKIWAYDGEIPTITKASLWTYTNHKTGIFCDGDYIHWKNLEICGFNQLDASVWYGFMVENSNHNLIELLNIHHNGAGMNIGHASDNNLVLNCDFHHNYDPLTLYDPYGNADGMGINTHEGTTNYVRGCRFWSNSDDGIDLYQNDGFVLIDSCWAFNNGYIPDTFNAAGDGNGFKLGKTPSDWGNSVMRTVTNCIAYKNRTSGFHQNEANAAIALYNNTAYMNGAQGFWFGSFNKLHILQNNISYHNASYCYLTSSSIVSNNTFLISNTANPAISVTDTDFISLDGMQLTRPRKADGSLPDIEFLHLASGSDLIDAGADAGLPYSGKAPDIGAFEFPVSEFYLNEPPIVNISSPTKGVTFTSPATVTIDIEANDPDGNITKVELYNGNIILGERTGPLYSFTLKDLPVGSYSLKAVATDNLKATTTSSSLELEVTSSYNENREYFNLYPNPNDGRFTINFTSPLVSENYTVTIVNLIGRTVYQEKLSKDDNVRQFDLSHLNPDTYVVMISGDTILMTQKFIKG